MEASWPDFLARRRERLVQRQRYGTAAEKVAENILDDLFTMALDWQVGDLNNQLDYADLVLTKQGLKRLLVEVKRPGSLSWDQPSIERALAQARRYADEQRVRSIAVSDGTLFYAADIANGGLRTRAKTRLDRDTPAMDLWWVSVDGIYRDAVVLDALRDDARLSSEEPDFGDAADTPPETGRLIHPKYGVPVECFAYAENAADPRTWRLPYRLADGAVDERRLAGAVRAVVSNYRGTRVNLPEAAVTDVLVRLGRAAAELGKLPGQTAKPLRTYRDLWEVLHQLDRLADVVAPD